MAGARAAAAGAVLLGRGCAAAVLPAGEGAVGHYFDGPIEVVAGYPDVGFTWLESPVWSQEGQFLLFSDVKWEDLAGNTTGMLWKYDAERGVVTELLPRAGAVGPGLPPASLGDYAEAGPNGMAWSSSGDPTLLLCQHAMGRIVSFSLDDVSSGGIADAGVTVVADEYGGAPLNSPNDLTLVGDVLLFSDPPYGLQFRGDTSLDQSYERMPQPATNIYFLRSPFNGSEAPQVLLSDVWRPNGLALSAAGKLFVAHTDFDEPHYSVYDTAEGDVTQVVTASERRFNMTHRIDPAVNAGLPPLADGMTAYGDVVFAAGPGGVYVLDGTSGEEAAFVRIDDLVSNVGAGGGYLWVTANRRLLRIRLAEGPVDALSAGGRALGARALEAQLAAAAGALLAAWWAAL